MARNDPRLVRFARQMRRYPTRGEAVLWMRLRNRELGVRFRRQEPIGAFIADFACRRCRTIVEVDGDTHVDVVRDDARDRWFVAHGWLVLRFWDDDVIEATDRVVEIIGRAIDDSSSFSNPFRWNP
jgi:very-short-patch-repair endonuclease